MNKCIYKLFFIVCAFVCVVLPTTDLHAKSRDFQVLEASADICRFSAMFTADLQGLDRVDAADSTFHYEQVYLVSIPHGAVASLVGAEGKNAVVVQSDMNFDGTRGMSLAPLARLGEVREIRGHALVPVHIAPLQGGNVYSRVTVEIAIEGGIREGTPPVADPFFERVVGHAVVNLSMANRWPVAEHGAARRAVASGPFTGVSDWVKIAVTTTGLHSVSGANLASTGMNLPLVSSSIRIFNAGGKPLPVYNIVERPEFTELALYMDDGNDGSFDSGDHLYFFGEAVDRWNYVAGESVGYINNVYTKENIYWLTAGGTFVDPAIRMTSVDGSVTSVYDTLITSFICNVRAEQDNVLLTENDGHIEDYYRWYWAGENSLTFFVPTPGAMANDTANISVFGRTGGVSPTDGYVDVSVNSIPAFNKSCNTFSCFFKTTSLTDGLSGFDFVMERPSIAPVPYFDYMELRYKRSMLVSGGYLDATFGAYAGRAQVQAGDQGLPGQPYIFDLADRFRPVVVSDPLVSGGSIRFEVELETTNPNRFWITTLSAAQTPESFERVSTTDLTSNVAQTDCFVIAPEMFHGDLDEYLTYRRAQGHSIQLVSVEDIMDNFGFGLYDPTAIRDFLKFAYENYPAPRPYSVLFVGDATHDFLDALDEGQPNYVPPYVHGLGSSVDQAYSDDNYVYFGDYGILDSDTTLDTTTIPINRGFDMMSARWPIASASDIDVILNKIMTYESNRDFGSWRNSIMLVADDEYSDASYLEPFHATQTEILEKEHIPAHFLRRKVYMYEFDFANNLKPEANDAIVRAINDGALIVNYVGHGNPDVWAHERVFTRQSDLPRLTNSDRLPLFFAASCAIGFFDDPARESMGEALLSMANGGAIGVISATRLVYSQDNALFNRQVYDVLLDNNDITIGEAVYFGKTLKQYGNRDYPIPLKNDRAYIYFGDPLLKLAAPRLDLEFTDVPDSLSALARSRVAGRVLDDAGQPVVVDGTALISVYDSDREQRYVLGGGTGDEFDYKVSGPTIYRGSASIIGGNFEFEFITPLDIGFGGTEARIAVYAVLDTIDAVGQIDSLAVSSQIAEVADSIGPEITVSVGDRGELRSGDMVTPEENLVIRISDSSGVNLATSLGHGITLEVDGNDDMTANLTEAFSYDQDNFTGGELTYQLKDLEQGTHTLKIKAWDNANNSSTRLVTVEVASSATLAINDLLNYPNPMADSTTFFFDLTQAVSRFSLDIFTLSGRKIKTMYRYNVPVGSHEVPWDGRDADGDRIATGVYIYKASANPVTGGDAVESFGKIVVVN